MDIRMVNQENHIPDAVPLSEVYIDTLTDASEKKIIDDLNKIFPLRKLSHLKRNHDGKVILFASNLCLIEDVHNILSNKGVLVEKLKNEVKKINVPSEPPMFTREYIIAKKYWPIKFNPDKNIENRLTSEYFSAKESYRHGEFMKITIMLSKFFQKPATIIVDPLINSIVSVGLKEMEKGPCRHSTMTALDNVANIEGDGAWTENCPSREALVAGLNVLGIPEEIYELLLDQIGIKCRFGGVPSESGPFFCDGFVAYLTHEPCTMCAMALVHAGIKCVFYDKSSEVGALGTLCKLHLVEKLECPFKVFVLNFAEE